MKNKHTTVILPSDKISRKELQDKIQARIEEINSAGWASCNASQVVELKYVLSLLKTIR